MNIRKMQQLERLGFNHIRTRPAELLHRPRRIRHSELTGKTILVPIGSIRLAEPERLTLSGTRFCPHKVCTASTDEAPNFEVLDDSVIVIAYSISEI